jgi:hypothetical protein
MRLVQSAHGGLGYLQAPGRALSFLSLAVRNGREPPAAPGTRRRRAGGFVVLDLDALDRDAILPVDPLHLLFTRGNASLVRDVVVGGRVIVRDGKATGVDLSGIERDVSGRGEAVLGVGAGVGAVEGGSCAGGLRGRWGVGDAVKTARWLNTGPHCSKL